MTVHHLDCGPMQPLGGRVLTGRPDGDFVAHCLLVETSGGLVLVDTGFGTRDVDSPKRLGRSLVATMRPRLAMENTALHQVRGLGYDPADVRHIVLTHLDCDHAGGLADFPDADVHVLAEEYRSATNPNSLPDRQRYAAVQWEHRPRWATHEVAGEQWLGFRSVSVLADCAPDVLLVPLRGHTRGHCGVAVRDGAGWLLHCGDAYFSRDETDPVNPRCPRPLSVLQRYLAVAGRDRLHNQQRLRALRRTNGDTLTLFCAHDANEFAELSAPHSRETS